MKKIELSGYFGRGIFVLIDDEDFEFLSQWTWCVSPKGYAIRTCRLKSKKTVYLHVEVAMRMGLKLGKRQVDHRDRDKTDCRRENLRIATNQQNQANVGIQKNNTSGFKGVGFHKLKGKWIARIGVSYKRIQLGEFNTRDEANEAYKAAAAKYFGEFAGR